MPQISVILPCLNEEATVAATIRRAQEGIKNSGLIGEIIVVDNGSSDRSAEIARSSGARVVSEARPGYGSALLRGFTEARADIMVMADADDTYQLDHLASLVKEINNGADVAIANRYANMQPNAMPWLHRKLGTPVISWLLRSFYGVQVGDSQSGYRAFTRKCLDELELRSSGMELASEMLAKASVKGLKVTEVPSTYLVRDGESKLRTFRDGWRHLRLILTLTPTHLYIIPGILLLLFGLLTFALAFNVSSGLAIGGLNWQPVFAGPIFVVVGLNAALMGMGIRRLRIKQGLRQTPRLDQLDRFVSLEFLLATAALMITAGIAIDLFIFSRWIGGLTPTNSAAQLAAVAQTLVIAGTNTGLIGFLIASYEA